jgi:hypothetical protein
MGVALYVLALWLRQQIDYGWFGAAIFFSLAVAVSRDRVKERIRQHATRVVHQPHRNALQALAAPVGNVISCATALGRQH